MRVRHGTERHSVARDFCRWAINVRFHGLVRDDNTQASKVTAAARAINTMIMGLVCEPDIDSGLRLPA